MVDLGFTLNENSAHVLCNGRLYGAQVVMWFNDTVSKILGAAAQTTVLFIHNLIINALFPLFCEQLQSDESANSTSQS